MPKPTETISKGCDSPQKVSAKRSYSSPKLVEHGNVVDLTRKGQGSAFEPKGRTKRV